MNLRTSVVAALLVLGSTTPQLAGVNDFDPIGTYKGTIGCRTQINGTLDNEVFVKQIIKISPREAASSWSSRIRTIPP